MTSRAIRILLIADTHLGFDYPFRPRVKRRRRGHDFFANFKLALRPALHGDVDLVVHGGDLLFRTRIHDALMQLAMEPLLQVAEKGIPVYVVPGNHERSRIPLQIWTVHPNLHIFHEPQTFTQEVSGMKVALSGFPFARRIRDEFPAILHQTGHQHIKADMHLLCIHQAVEGAVVGPSNFTFSRGDDVIQGRDIPEKFAAVLAGHIHRSQVLSGDLSGKRMPAPVIYPGSIERTAFAERFESKNYAVVNLEKQTNEQAVKIENRFHRLPARPMVILDLDMSAKNGGDIMEFLARKLGEVDPDSVVRLRIMGADGSGAREMLKAARIREIAPKSMNISMQFADGEGAMNGVFAKSPIK